MSNRLLDALHSGRLLLMDGAMGTELQRLGQSGAAADIHRAYAAAGAEVLLTNTFQTNPVASGSSFAVMFRDAVRTARNAVGPNPILLADIGPIMAPGAIQFPKPADVDPLAELAAECGCDGVLIETCSTMRVRHAMERAARYELPILLSLCFRHAERDCVSFDGYPPGEFASRAAEWGACALGVNCGRDITVAECAAIVSRYREVCRLPLFARPNAGAPQREGDRWVYPRTPELMAAELPELLEAGATMIGGCCGTTPAHIAAFRPVIDRWNRR
jgi:5-methyltetrahydrofolate--homocysteine methyltransferase